MVNEQFVLYVLTNDVYDNNEISDLRNDFKKQVLINSCPVLFIRNFISIDVSRRFVCNFYKKAIKNRTERKCLNLL